MISSQQGIGADRLRSGSTCRQRHFQAGASDVGFSVESIFPKDSALNLF